jgi:hypothetical protein
MSVSIISVSAIRPNQSSSMPFEVQKRYPQSYMALIEH